jgi:hypothetical protein
MCPDEEAGSVTEESPTSKGSLMGSLVDRISVVLSSGVVSSSLSQRGVVPQPPVLTSDAGRANCDPVWARPGGVDPGSRRKEKDTSSEAARPTTRRGRA